MGFFYDFIAANRFLVTIFEAMRGIFIFLDLVLFVLIIFSLSKLIHYRPKFVYDPRKWQRYVKKKKEPELATPVVMNAWGKVKSKMQSGAPDAMRLAVIEADGAVDEVLRRMGLAGETFAERLGRLSPDRYSTLDRVWDAHRLRNNLVHTPDFQVAPSKAEEAVAAYEAFLKEIRALK